MPKYTLHSSGCIGEPGYDDYDNCDSLYQYTVINVIARIILAWASALFSHIMKPFLGGLIIVLINRYLNFLDQHFI